MRAAGKAAPVHESVEGRRRQGLEAADLVDFRWLQEISLAADGGHVAYTVRDVDVPNNDYRTQLFVRELATGKMQRLAQGNVSASSPVWSRDGARLAYALRTGEQNAVVVVDRRTGHQRTYDLPGAAMGALDWSPCGRRVAGVQWTQMRAADEARPAPGISAPTVRVVRRLRYKQDGSGWVYDRYRQIWILDLESGDLQQLTTAECDFGEPAWSWSGRYLACTAMRREQNVAQGYGQIVIYDVENGGSRPLIEGWTGAALSAQWRRDDGAIAFVGHPGPAPVNRRLFYGVWICDVQGGEARELTSQIDQTVGNYAVADQRAGLTSMTVQWPAGAGALYFLLTERGATHLYCAGEEQAPQQLVGGEGVTFAYSATPDGTLAYGRATSTNPGDLYLRRAGETARLTALNSWLDDRALALPQTYTYEGLDGAKVQAWIMKPPHFREDRVYPTIVYVHCSMFSWDFNHELQCLANAGFVVAYFNQRGTTAGYGQAHALGNYYGKHEQEFAEIMLGVDELAARPYVDETRMGVTGGSCGGFMTNWIVGHSDRFAAAVTQRSISDLVSKYGTSDNGPEQAESEGGGRPWDNVQQMWRSSPLAYVRQMHTPLLIIHSDEDHRCALSQAEELFAALRWLGRTVELVIFEGETHGLSRGGRPGNRVERIQRILRWFERYLSPANETHF